MDVKCGYKQTEVGVIPEEWSAKTIGDIGEPLIGLTYKPNNVKSDGLLVLRSSNIADGALRFEDNVFVDMDVPSRIIARKGDILICVRNGSRDLIGKCAKIDESAQGMTFGAFMAVLRTPFHNFVYYQFQSEVIQRQIHEHLGATINQITNKSLRSFRIPFPEDSAERGAIAAVLGDVDALLGALEKLIAKKRDLKQAAMQQLLTGQKRLPGFSGVWETSTVGCEFEIRLGKMLDVEKNSGVLKPYLGNRAVQWGRIDFESLSTVAMTRTDLERYRLLRGDLLVCEGGEVGRAAIWEAPIDECYYQKALHRLRPLHGFHSQLMVALLRFWSEQGMLTNYVTQTSIAHLTREKFAEVPMPVPPLPEQTAIAAVLSDMDAEIVALEARLAKTRALEQGMMQELLTGKTRLI